MEHKHTPGSSDPPEASDEDTDPGDGDQRIAALVNAVARAPVAHTARVADAEFPEPLREALAREFARAPELPAPGDVIAQRYRIDERIGAGGMGVVFRATQLATGRVVALKWMTFEARLRTEGERAAAFQRFVREAQATARIKHPHVVDVLDASHDPTTPFLVMEYLEGETLRAYLNRERTLSYPRALAILLPVLDAVAEAHRRGVVHRDLKPDNVFLVAGDHDAPVPKVLDFGVSRLRGVESNEISLTRTGTVLGTPAYMPLEQLRAQGDVDERTDVYALGVMFYEMLSGRRPFEAKNAPDFAAMLVCERPTPLSKHVPALRGQREAAVMKALSREPADRHADVAAMKRALAAPLSSHRRRLVSASVVAGGLLVAALGTGLRAYTPAAEPTPPADERLATPQTRDARASAAQPARPAAVAAPADLPEPPPAVRRNAERKRGLAPGAPSRAQSAAAQPAPTASTELPAPVALPSLSADDFQERAPQPAPAPAPAARRAQPSLALERTDF